MPGYLAAGTLWVAWVGGWVQVAQLPGGGGCVLRAGLAAWLPGGCPAAIPTSLRLQQVKVVHMPRLGPGAPRPLAPRPPPPPRSSTPQLRPGPNGPTRGKGTNQSQLYMSLDANGLYHAATKRMMQSPFWLAPSVPTCTKVRDNTSA